MARELAVEADPRRAAARDRYLEETANFGDGTVRYQKRLFRPLADPAPLGLFAFGMTTALLQGYNVRWTEPATNNFTYGYAFFYGGLAQLLAGMWEFARNNTFAATAFSSYGSFWIGLAFIETLSAAGIYTGSAPDGEQLFLCLWGLFTFFMFVATIRQNLALISIFFFLTITFFLLAAGVTDARANKAGGYFGLITAACAWWLAAAKVINEGWDRTVIPLFDTSHLFPPRGVRNADATAGAAAYDSNGGYHGKTALAPGAGAGAPAAGVGRGPEAMV